MKPGGKYFLTIQEADCIALIGLHINPSSCLLFFRDFVFWIILDLHKRCKASAKIFHKPFT